VTLFAGQLVAGATVALLATWAGLSLGKPLAINYRGRSIPAVLGIPVVASLCWVVPFALIAVAIGQERPTLKPYGAILLGILLVFVAGLYDDLQPVRTRGLVHQIRLAFTGRLTSGVVKLILIVAAACLVAFSITGPGSPPAWLCVPVLAGSANLWNLLDVRPGRALKLFLLAAIGLVAAVHDSSSDAGVLLATGLGAAAAILAFDVRERAMLGDSGANVLGFVIGVAVCTSASTAGLVVGLVVIVILHALAETVTLSRIIEATPPLRWFDQLGRRKGIQDRP
jgi:UDP-GlcNAc:undecaprenyl-phosphate/decaprenyl-phosphate GlcNAc-1-phosphate transferase